MNRFFAYWLEEVAIDVKADGRPEEGSKKETAMELRDKIKH